MIMTIDMVRIRLMDAICAPQRNIIKGEYSYLTNIKHKCVVHELKRSKIWKTSKDYRVDTYNFYTLDILHCASIPNMMCAYIYDLS